MSTRRGPGSQFQPGKSGNPKGRPKLGESLSEAVRSEWPRERIVKEMSKLALSARTEQTKFAALNWLAERGHGRVPQGVNLDVSGVGPEAEAMLVAIKLTPHERRKALENDDDAKIED